MDLSKIQSLSHQDFNFSEIKDIKEIKRGICFNTYEIISSEEKVMILKSAKNKTEIENIRKLKLEFDIQNSLTNHFPVAKQILFFKDYSQIDFPFYISEKIIGESKSDMDSIKLSFDLLLKIHTFPLENLEKKNIKIEKKISSIIDRYFLAYENNAKQKNKDIEKIYEWLVGNIPNENNLCLVHNDWRWDNIIFLDKEIKAVIDWELCSISYAGLDIGTAMSYLNRQEEEEVLNYLDIDFKNYDFFKVFGILKLFSIIEAGIKNNVDDIIKNEKIQDFLKIKLEEGIRIIKK